MPAYDRIILRRADTLAGLKDAEEVTVWQRHESGIMSMHVWAPELHYLKGRWYIYFAAGEVEDKWAIRPYVLECQGCVNPPRVYTPLTGILLYADPTVNPC